jgi:Tol biopolymer transport system component
MFHTSSIQRIDVYDASSDVFVYDTQTHTILQDTLIMKKYWAENCPNFSPDGKWLYFTTARRQIYPTDYDKEKYSLCRVSFDAETGHIGTEVDTLVNTAHTGKSVSWPRASYDGRFLMYAEADYGYFTVWHPEAELWLYDLKNGTTRRMDEVNSKRSESLHAWSKNSHWFLFTSRRDDGLYTRLYFAGIDTTGHATKPFLLPQRNPKEYYRRLMYSYNTPDFTEKPVDKNSRPSKKMIEEGERIQNKVRN